MAKSGSIFLVLILSIAGLGLGGYSFYSLNFGKCNCESNYELVGLWEDVTKNTLHPIMNLDYAWLLEVGNPQIVNSEFIILNQSTGYKDTRFHLVKPGIYKISINVYLVDLLDNQGYAMDVFKDGENYSMLSFKHIFHVVTPNAGEHVNIDFYLESNGTNYYEFGCYTLSAPFALITDQKYNHLAIEYVHQ